MNLQMRKPDEVGADEYAQKYLKQLMFALNNEDGQDTKMAMTIINKIYQDGYEDGANSQDIV